jgi:hypothetical protein
MFKVMIYPLEYISMGEPLDCFELVPKTLDALRVLEPLQHELLARWISLSAHQKCVSLPPFRQ